MLERAVRFGNAALQSWMAAARFGIKFIILYIFQLYHRSVKYFSLCLFLNIILNFSVASNYIWPTLNFIMVHGTNIKFIMVYLHMIPVSDPKSRVTCSVCSQFSKIICVLHFWYMNDFNAHACKGFNNNNRYSWSFVLFCMHPKFLLKIFQFNFTGSCFIRLFNLRTVRFLLLLSSSRKNVICLFSLNSSVSVESPE